MSVLYKIRIKKNLIFDKKIYFYYRNFSTPKSRSRISQENRIGPEGWLLLIIPTTAFGLGCWQVRRREWKLNLIKELETKTRQTPQEFPNDLHEVNYLEYQPIKVRGVFNHEKEILLGPRNLVVEEETKPGSTIFSSQSKSHSGYLVITPFTITDKNITILINRGWVPHDQKNPQSRLKGQISGETELVGIVRLNENRAPFMPENTKDNWFYRDVNKMAEMTNAEPIYLDASSTSTVSGGPIGGQTRVNLRNEHLSYLVTWFSLSAATAIMWFNYFIRRKL